MDYKSNFEVYLLQEIIDENYFMLDEKNIKIILNFYMKLSETNIERAELEGYDKIRTDKYKSLFKEQKYKIFDVCGWINIMQKIYMKLADEEKNKFVRELYAIAHNTNSLYSDYCEKSIRYLISKEINNVFNGKRKQEDFVEVFRDVLKEKFINDFYSEIIKEKLISYDKFDATEMIMQLNKKNCTYLFTYIVMYYSIYRFRFEWKYVNVDTLKLLWNQHGSMQVDAKDVIYKISKSNINHRFTDEMYTKFMEYINININDGVINTVYKDNIMDVFYVWLIKTCFIHENDFAMYPVYRNSFNFNIQIIIINKLSKHDELMERDSVFNWIRHMRHNIFVNEANFPDKLDITLRNLLLVNIDPEIMLNYIAKNLYYNAEESIGIYLLIKIEKLSTERQEQIEIKEMIKRVFVLKNMCIDQYIKMIEKECHICRCDINYIQKEKMKRYLSLII